MWLVFYHVLLLHAGKKSSRGPSFKLSGVTVSVKSVLQAMADLEPLAAVVPVDKEERKK